MINFNISRFVESTTRNVDPSKQVTAEGCALVIDTAHPNSVAPSAGLSTEVFAGVSFSQQQPITSAPKMEELVIAADGTIVLARQPTAGTIRVTIGGTVFTADAVGTAQGTIAAGKYSQAAAGSQTLVFPVAQEGLTAVVLYRYAPTVAEVITLQGYILPGGDSGNLLNVVGVVTKGDLYVDQYDTTADWTLTTIKVGANGLFTTSGSGAAIAGARVLAVPTADQPFLGLSIGFNG